MHSLYWCYWNIAFRSFYSIEIRIQSSLHVELNLIHLFVVRTNLKLLICSICRTMFTLTPNYGLSFVVNSKFEFVALLWINIFYQIYFRVLLYRNIFQGSIMLYKTKVQVHCVFHKYKDCNIQFSIRIVLKIHSFSATL